MARPKKKLDDEQIKQVEKLAAVLTVGQIADFFGMCENTLMKLREENPEIDEAYKRGRSRAIESVAQSLLSLAKEGNIAAICFYLKTQAGWRETQVVESHNTDETIHRVVFEMPSNNREIIVPSESFKALKPGTNGGNGRKPHPA